MINEKNVQAILRGLRESHDLLGGKDVYDRSADEIGEELGYSHCEQYPMEDVLEAIRRYIPEHESKHQH